MNVLKILVFSFIFIITGYTLLNGQSLKTQELGRLRLSDVKTSVTLDNKIIVPTLGEDEGILRIQLGPKIQALLLNLGNANQAEITIQFGRDIVLLTEVSSINFPQETYYQIRFKGQYVGNQQSSRPTIQIGGLPYFSLYKDVLRLYKNKVNTAVLEIDKAPVFKNNADYSNLSTASAEKKKLKAKRKKILWLFVLSTVAGSAFLLTNNNGGNAGSDFPTPPSRPSN